MYFLSRSNRFALYHRNARIEKWVKRLGKKLGFAKAKAYLIPWEKVLNIGISIEIDFDLEKTATFELERRLRKHVIERIPGA